MVWNLGFFPYPECREWASQRAYEQGVARLFEGMVLRPLGLGEGVEETHSPGNAATFVVEVTGTNVELLVDGNLPSEPGRLWGKPALVLTPGIGQLRFVNFFDWYQIGVRDLRLIEVEIERLDERPELVGRHALIELDQVSIWAPWTESGKADD